MDVAVVDLGLPDMDGMELVREVRGRRPAAKVFVLTGYDVQELRPALERLGVEQYMQKGRSPIEFMDRLRGLRC